MENPPGFLIGELELISFSQTEVKSGTGLLVDARTASWHAKGTIPGSVNIPFTTFANDTVEMKSSNYKYLNSTSISAFSWLSVITGIIP